MSDTGTLDSYSGEHDLQEWKSSFFESSIDEPRVGRAVVVVGEAAEEGEGE